MSDIVVIFPGSGYHHPITMVLSFGISKANPKFIIKMQPDFGGWQGDSVSNVLGVRERSRLLDILLLPCVVEIQQFWICILGPFRCSSRSQMG